MGSDEESVNRAASVLNHPIRRKIIKTLGEKGPLSWKELSEAIGTSTGALYHHLDVLERIVSRAKDRRYELTKLGLEVYQHVRRDESPYAPGGVSKLFKDPSRLSLALDIFAPRSLISRLSTGRVIPTAAVLILASVLSTVAYFTKVEVLFVSVIPGSDGISAAALVLVGVGVTFGVLYGGSAAWRVRANALPLVVASCMSFLPLSLFSVAVWLAAPRGIGAWPGGAVGLTVALLALQALSVGILGAGLSVATGVRIEKTLSWGLVLLYASTVFMLVYGVRLA